jgi:hypothetical protein
MKYKVEKGTKLFEKLDALGDRMMEVNKAAFTLVKEMGFKEFHTAGTGFVFAGGISAVRSKTKPEGYVYAFGPSEREAFFPKKNKANKELLAKIEALPIIKADELNTLVNFDPFADTPAVTRTGGRNISFHPGISWGKEYILIEVSHHYEESYKPAKDMIEITTSEYQKLHNSKKKK